MVTLTYKGRLPGVVCESALPRRETNVPRLDIAGFVGFAERGPLNTPVMVEDISQYRAIFGGDLLVARNDGLPIYAYLPQTVQHFFDNGGRRCYVVRVAGADARPSCFEIPGMVSWNGTDLRRVIAPAAWAGRWSDRMSVGAQLRTTPLRLPTRHDVYRPNLPEAVALDLEVPSATTVQPGDIVCLHFADNVRLMLRVAIVDVAGMLPETQHDISITVSAVPLLAYSVDVTAPPNAPNLVERLSGEIWQALPAVAAPVEEAHGWSISLPEDEIILVGDILRLSFSGVTLLFPVTQVDWAYDDATETRFQRVLSRQPLRNIALKSISGIPRQVDYLGFDLLIHEGNRMLEVWRDLSFGNWTEVLAKDSISISDLGNRSMRLRAPAVADFFPLGMDELPFFNRPLPDMESSGLDGLDSFQPEALFLDPQFDGYGLRTLMGRAEELLYFSDPPQRQELPCLGEPPQKLTKLHSLIPIDEVALIAIPDLVHRPWNPPEPLEEPPPEPEPEPEPPDWSSFQDCPVEVPPPEPERRSSEPLSFESPTDDLLSESFVQQLALLPVMVRDWEYTIADLAALVRIQEALVNVCAARADAMAILTVPQHFGWRELVDWQQQIVNIPGFRDGRPLSYAAAYHGWTQIRELATPDVHPLRNVPPDGTVCGMIAARELQRGAWVAPANESLRGVVGLTPTLNEDDWMVLFDKQINLIQQQPGRFTLLSAHTLSMDHLFLQISVRRLLILLRKLVLRQGDQYVFESNDTRFQRRVQVSFERLLTSLLENGALTAFEVVTGDAVNTRSDYDNGRLIIEIKVAPSQPIEFITVVLLRSGENLLEVIER